MRRRILLAAIGFLVAVLLAPPSRARVRGDADVGTLSTSAELLVWNRSVTTFRADFEDWTPEERVLRASARIRAIEAEHGEWRVDARAETFGDERGYLFSINGEFAFRLLDGDVDREAGLSLDEAARAAEAKLREAMESRRLQRDWRFVLRGVAIALGVTLAFIASWIAFSRVRRKLRARLRARFAGWRARIAAREVNVLPVIGGLWQVITRLLTWSVYALLTYLWLALVLTQFPFTEPWGRSLGGFLLRVLTQLGWGMLHTLPDLCVVLVVGALAHAFNRGVGSYFRSIERGEASIPWLTIETARTSRQILALVTWLFAVVVAYPYIPGSETAAFKGVTVFVGLMLSLGSTGLVNQLMSGLTVIYSRAYRQGEFVRIGEHEGRVVNLGMLATTLRKSDGVEMSIPNTVVTSNMIANFSRAGTGSHELIATTVTIGYDVPWRQAHALLQLAAQRTPGLTSDLAPFVVQRALSDFFVEYQLNAHLLRPDDRVVVTTRLHAEIQDAFNEHGVQIMSPHFNAQPDKTVLVPREKWFAAPAASEPTPTR